jgi:hypothetical protein
MGSEAYITRPLERSDILGLGWKMRFGFRFAQFHGLAPDREGFIACDCCEGKCLLVIVRLRRSTQKGMNGRHNPPVFNIPLQPLTSSKR